MQDIKLALWKNDKREKASQPILKGGKPQEIDGAQYWVSAWINAPKDASPEVVKRIEALVDYLSEHNGKYPIVNVSLSPANGMPQSAPTPAAGGAYNDEIPFASVRGLV